MYRIDSSGRSIEEAESRTESQKTMETSGHGQLESWRAEPGER